MKDSLKQCHRKLSARPKQRAERRWLDALPVLSAAVVLAVVAPGLAPWIATVVAAEDAVATSSKIGAGSGVPIPPRPTEPRAANVYQVLEMHCARCHQSGRTTAPLASGGLAEILDIDSIARDRALVHPGVPDASRLYDVLVTRHAPLEVFSTQAGSSDPDPDDIGRVRTWIANLSETVQDCPDRSPVTRAQMFDAIRETQRLARDDAADLRFVSLAHLHNACSSEKDMISYRQGLTKLLNGLSRKADGVSLAALDREQTVYQIRLSDLGWTQAEWNAIQDAYPETLAGDMPFDIRSEAQSRVPVVHGDWLASVAADTPLYYQLLDVPMTLDELAKRNGVDLKANVASAVSRRAAIANSQVTRGNRLAERHSGAHGGFWLSYDFASDDGRQNIFAYPVGPTSRNNVRPAFKADQIRAAYVLPNGFLGFALYNRDGSRISAVLPGIERRFKGVDARFSEPTTTAGGNCMSCHTVGPVRVRDQFLNFARDRPSVLNNARRDAAIPLFASDSEMTLLQLGDIERYRKALLAAGVDPERRVAGHELVAGLAERYRRDGDVVVAAADVGLSRDAFIKRLDGAKGEAAIFARRLRHGVLPRHQLMRLYELLSTSETMAGSNTPAASGLSGGFLRDIKTEIGLSMWLDEPRARPGELVTLKVQSDTPCYLTVIGVDADGTGTVLFPNDFDTDHKIAADTAVSIPNADAHYQLRYESGGTETILARCSMRSQPPVGIEHDFVRQKFTVLGNWENYIRDTLNTEAELRNDPEKAARARRAQEASRRRGESRRSRRSRRRQRERELRAAAAEAVAISGTALRDGRAVLIIDSQ